MSESAGFAAIRDYAASVGRDGYGGASSRSADRQPAEHQAATAFAPGPGEPAPDDDMPALVRRAWSDVLGIAEAELGEDFFHSGGSSLPALRLAARLGLSIRQVFALRTQAAMAQELIRRQNPAAPRPERQNPAAPRPERQKPAELRSEQQKPAEP